MKKAVQIQILIDAANRGIAARQMLQKLFPKDAKVVLDTGKSLRLDNQGIDWAKSFKPIGGRHVKNNAR